MSKEIALDLRRYNTPQKLSSLPADTASLSIEASDTGMPRINPHFYIKRGDDYVRIPGKDRRDILEMFVQDRNDPATSAARQIRESLLKDQTNTAYVWISGPYPYPEARIEIGAKKKTKSGKFEYQKCYGISTKLGGAECLSLGQLLVSISQYEIDFPKTLDELRNRIIKLNVPNGMDPFEYLSKLIKLPEENYWKAILDGTADKNKAKALKTAVSVTKPIMNNPKVIYSNPFVYGTYIENQMGSEGFAMNPAKFGCGVSNSSMLNSDQTSTSEYRSTVSHESADKCQICGKPGSCGWCVNCWETIGKFRN